MKNDGNLRIERWKQMKTKKLVGTQLKIQYSTDDKFYCKITRATL